MTSRSEIHGIFSMAISLPETWACTDVEKTSVSRGFAWACTRKVQCRCFAKPATGAQSRQRTIAPRIFMPIDKGFDRNFATPKTLGLSKPAHEASHYLALSDTSNGRGHLWPGSGANSDTAKTRLVEPHSSSIFSGRNPAIQRSKVARALSRSPDHAADRKAFRGSSARN